MAEAAVMGRRTGPAGGATEDAIEKLRCALKKFEKFEKQTFERSTLKRPNVELVPPRHDFVSKNEFEQGPELHKLIVFSKRATQLSENISGAMRTRRCN